jgi:hypothetical protein
MFGELGAVQLVGSCVALVRRLKCLSGLLSLVFACVNISGCFGLSNLVWIPGYLMVWGASSSWKERGC